ncbi:enoyl-CoA hydratase/isomerase family protein [Pseudonocardia spinosispora]|uniref:enoyl-CoA hydratase/isomerase family protein n=1 Tax=Pseudonocardia spinosispora TaxID=103441 RepID=UPI00040EE52A|nr:enoyl-CoA hydratase/isomerase family protein [Pseudonocardia spinosispora]
MSQPTDSVLYDKQGHIALITLNRPEAKNAIDPGMDQRLAEIWYEFRDDDQLHVAILTGAGDAFCAGADRDTWFTRWVDADPAQVRSHVEGIGFAGLTRGLRDLNKPIIAAINGWTLGGALELALACDIRIASQLARFGLPLVRYGFHTGDGGITRLIHTCGIGVALDLQLTGEPIDAQRALACNLVTRVVAPDELLPAAFNVANLILANNQTAIRSAKRTTLDLIGRTLEDQLRLEAWNGYTLSQGQDILAAFAVQQR